MEDKFNEGDCLSFECSGMNDNSYLCFREHWELFPDFHSRNSIKSEGFNLICRLNLFAKKKIANQSKYQ